MNPSFDLPPSTTRPLRKEDEESWLRLWKGYQKFYNVDIAHETSQLTFQRLLDAAEPMHCALAIDGSDAPVGLVHWIYHRSNWTVGDYCYLQDLYVDNGSRGCGHGQRLIKAVYSAADEAGAARVYWLTHESNREAMKLYDRIAQRSGFIQYRHLLRS